MKGGVRQARRGGRGRIPAAGDAEEGRTGSGEAVTYVNTLG